MKDMIYIYIPYILILMKVCILDDKVMSTLKAFSFGSVVQVYPNGFSGGIWVLWDSSTSKVVIQKVH